MKRNSLFLGNYKLQRDIGILNIEMLGVQAATLFLENFTFKMNGSLINFEVSRRLRFFN